MMDCTRLRSSSAGGDHLSKLGDGVLGHVLSFLPAKEAARAALLSSRWRHVFTAVHTVSLEEPEPPLTDYDSDDTDMDSWNRGPPPDPNPPPSFPCAVTNALLARNRRAGAAPLRALHVDVEDGYKKLGWGAHPSTVDQWVSYAVHQAAAPDDEGLRLDLRLRRASLCDRRYSLGRSGEQGCPPLASRRRRRPSSSSDSDTGSDSSGDRQRRLISISSDGASSGSESSPRRRRRRTASGSRRSSYCRSPSPGALSSSSDDTLSWPSPRGADEEARRPNKSEPALRTVPPVLYSCAALRSLSLGHCRLAPPAEVKLPSLETLLLSHVSVSGSRVGRIIAGSPRLADLTLEACEGMVRLRVPTGARLRRLALRCCHRLATVAVDASELEAFEYRGAVPESTLLTLHGGSAKVAYCKVDICGREVSSEQEVTRLRQLLQLFANTKRLHLESARLGSGMDRAVPMDFPGLPALRHLELRGRLPDDDDVVVAAVSRMLGQAPNLEALSLVFHPEGHGRLGDDPCYRDEMREAELLDAHYLKYSGLSVVAAPGAMAECLRSKVREINLVHYQGGMVQRALVKFLLCNAPVMEKLWCEFAAGPLWTQTQLMREIKSWVMNKSASTHFL